MVAANLPSPMAVSSVLPSKVGTSCPAVGRKLQQKKNTLVCKRVGKRLVWTRAASKGGAATTKSLAPTGNYATDAQCADQELPRSTYWQVSAGFPKFNERIPSSGSVRVLVLPVDFPDAVATGSPATDMLPITRALNDVYGARSPRADWSSTSSLCRRTCESVVNPPHGA